MAGSLQQISDCSRLSGKGLTVGSRGVVRLSGSVLEKVDGPTEKLVQEEVPKNRDRRVLEGLSELALSHL